MAFDIEYIENLIKLLENSNLSEMFLQDGEQVVELKKGSSVDKNVNKNNSEILEEKYQPEQNRVDVSSSSTTSAEKPVKEIKKITSPMVGTFYGSNTPGGRAFVQAGDTVAAGQVVCIIEAMKLMNEIESEVSGTVVEVCVEDGQPVEYGQVLMYVE